MNPLVFWSFLLIVVFCHYCFQGIYLLPLTLDFLGMDTGFGSGFMKMKKSWQDPNKMTWIYNPIPAMFGKNSSIEK